MVGFGNLTLGLQLKDKYGRVGEAQLRRMTMISHKRSVTQLALGVALAPIIAIIYIGFLVHLAFLYAKLVVDTGFHVSAN